MIMWTENIKRINSKLQQLLKQYYSLQKENEKLSSSIKLLQEDKAQNLQTIELLQLQLHILKSSNGSMTEQEKKLFDKQIGGYIKEIEKCIALISE